ncbi:MAG: M3 family metallopeptidase [Bacillota bacterium]
MQQINNQAELQAYLDSLESKLEALNNQISSLAFQKYVDKQPNPKLAELEQQRAAIMLDQSLSQLVNRWLGKADCPVLERRLVAWSNNLLAAQVTARPEIMQLTRSLADRIISHRYLVNGNRYDLGTIRGLVRSNPDRSLRRAAWSSYSELSDALAADMLQLFKLRNAAAQEAGFNNYVDMSLHINGMATAEVEAILQELTEATESTYRRILQSGAERLGLDSIEPWDVQYILEQAGEVPNHHFPKDRILPALRQWCDAMGIDLEQLGISHHWIDIPYNGLTMTLSRNDIRILGNPTDGYAYYKTAFHELGHALHSALKQVDSMVLRRESGIFTEGLAEVFGYVSHHPEWMRQMGLNDAEIRSALAGSLGPWFFYLRQRTAYCLFEYAAYQDPGQNMDQLFARTEAAITGGRLDHTPRWAANAWYVSYPVYWQNYVLADVMSSQVHHHLERSYGSLYNSPAAYDFVIQHYIAPGAMVPWMEKIETATGARLNAQALIADLNNH